MTVNFRLSTSQKIEPWQCLLGQGSDITSAWGGDGSAEFTAKVQECLVELRKMSGILEETGSTLQTQSRNYEAAQEANRANATRLMG